MRGRVAEVATVLAWSALLTAAIAFPVLRAPSERVFGMEIVGRHHDPFTVMAQFDRPVRIGVYSQPITDVGGAMFARLWGPVAAYNAVVLLSFPLSALAAYLLARRLAIGPFGATVAAAAYAFSPFHLAHAAYHPHVAQTQWMPLYLLALWHCLESGSLAAAGLLAIAVMGVTLSNFYGGLIAAVVTPVAVGAYWLTRSRQAPDAVRRLSVTAVTLAVMAVAGLAYVWWVARRVLLDAAVFAVLPGDAFRYSAKWWAYLVPPVAHPLTGERVRHLWTAFGVGEGLLELQISLGWGLVALAAFAVYRWLVDHRRDDAVGSVDSADSVPVLAAVAAAALVCSLSPERTIDGFRFVRPSALLHELVPMFRAYARFGVVVQLMTALLAGIGVDCLRRSLTRRSQVVWMTLVLLVAGEYAASPSALWRDALPTAGHRWALQQPGRAKVLDCVPFTRDSESIPWLTGYRVMPLGGSMSDCLEPNLSRKLAAEGYTHLLVRSHTGDAEWFAAHPPLEGLRPATNFADGLTYAVTANVPVIYTAGITGFYAREHDAERTWRWMGADAAWTIVNTAAVPIVATLDIELAAFGHPRQVELLLDGRDRTMLVVDPVRRRYQVEALTLGPGSHEMLFHPVDPPAVARDVIQNGDRRPLSLALGAWSWTVQGGPP